MKALMIATLIFLGGTWLFCATAIPFAMRTGAMSNALQLEADLKRWADGKVWEGKLNESDVQELFPDNYSLRFGGEHKTRNFREMIDDIARSSAPPEWPGLFMIGVGTLGAIHSLYTSKSKKRQKMEMVPPRKPSDSI